MPMTLFAPTDAPRFFALPPPADSARAFAQGLSARLSTNLGGPPEAMARVTLYTNTRRSERALNAAIEAGSAESGTPATFLPRIRLVGEFTAEAALLGLPPAVDPTRRLLALTRLAEAFLRAQPGFGPLSAAPALAGALAELIDELHGAGLTPDALDRLDVGEHAEHWGRTARFLGILRTAWPLHLVEAEGGAMDPEARRRAAVEAQVAAWEKAPPADPVIAVGSTGSTPATALLLQAIARLPQGAVVLPGLDPEAPADIWPRLGPDHPYAAIGGLLEGATVDPATVTPWAEAALRPARLRLLAQALRPAPVTDRWREAAPRIAAEAGEATADLALVEANGPREEAAAIALALRDAAEAGTAALVTPDRMLARRVTAALGRWGITPDDSAGRPLSLTPPGLLLGLIAGAVGRPMTAERLSAILRHPLTGAERGPHMRHVRHLERTRLRGGPTAIDWARLAAGAEGDFADWLARIHALLAPLEDPAPTLADQIARHRATAEALAGAALYDKKAGEEAAKFLDALAAAATAYDAAPADLSGYAALWSTLIAGRDAPAEAERTHDRIFIWGALEARMQTADLMVLGGLNDGVWPGLPDPDPWLSRQMRAQLGLSAPEARIGLSAHDFLQGAAGARVILTRSVKAGGAETIPSRWLIRLLNLLGAEDVAPHAVAAMRAWGAELLAEARRLDEAPKVDPEQRPNPKPPVTARPRKLSVTHIETLIRDPYAIYARHILRLRKLEPIGRAPDARDMGNALHNVMERFTRATAGAPAAELKPAFLRIAAESLAEDAPWPALRRLWLKRLERAADWFIDGEIARREAAEEIATERTGARTLSAPGGDFTLTATADRIDRTEGGYAIYDYKSGTPPTPKQIQHFAKQLVLEGAIAEAGGFTDLPPGPAITLAYLGLTGAKGGGETRDIDDPEAAVAEGWTRLAELIAAHDAPGQGYLARQRPAFIRYESDYDHLSRFGEWGDGAEDGE
jgi:inactivated superfamily I helicase/RecB family exonuclease